MMEQLVKYLKPLPVSTELEYPESDGKPMGETQIHIQAMMYLLAALQYYFRRAAQVYVSADMLMYFEEGDVTQFVVPDVFVVKGVSNHVRRTYKIWEEKAVPTVVLEITSRGTRYQDLANKKGLYEVLGVSEYFLFDPLDEYLNPRLQGFRLVDKGFQPIAPQNDGAILSGELNLLLVPDHTLLRLQDPKTLEILPTFDEAMEQVQSEAGRADSEAERAARAEAEVARLRDEVERLRKQKGD